MRILCIYLIYAAALFGCEVTFAAEVEGEHKIFSMISEVVNFPQKRPELQPKIEAALKALFKEYERETGEKLFYPEGSVEFGRNIVDPSATVVLASESISGGITKPSLLVARGSVSISIGREVSIIAGQYIHGGILGANHQGPKLLIASGKVIETGIGQGLLVVSPGAEMRPTGNSVRALQPPPTSSSLPDGQVKVWDALGGESSSIFIKQGDDIKKFAVGTELGGPFEGARLLAVTEKDYRALVSKGNKFQWLQLQPIPDGTPLAGRPPTPRMSNDLFRDKQLKIDCAHARKVLAEAENRKAVFKAHSRKIFGNEASTNTSTLWMQSIKDEHTLWSESSFHQIIDKSEEWIKTADAVEQAKNKKSRVLQARRDKLKRFVDEIWKDKSKRHMHDTPTYNAMLEEIGALEAILLAKQGLPVQVPFSKWEYNQYQ